MRKEFEFPEGVVFELSGKTLAAKGPKGSLERYFSDSFVKMSIQDKKIAVESKSEKRKEKAVVGTWISHTKNMAKGVSEGYEYTLKAIFSHFPLTIKVENSEFLVQNFLGEKGARKTKIIDGTEVTVKGQYITVKGIDKEKVGQMACDLERVTKVRNLDRRVFADGIYITGRG